MKYWPEFLGAMIGSSLTLAVAYLLRRYVYRLVKWYTERVKSK